MKAVLVVAMLVSANVTEDVRSKPMEKDACVREAAKIMLAAEDGKKRGLPFLYHSARCVLVPEAEPKPQPQSQSQQTDLAGNFPSCPRAQNARWVPRC